MVEEVKTSIDIQSYYDGVCIPKIYAYTTNQYKYVHWTGVKEGRGLLKIGYTTKNNVEDRIWEQFPTKTPEQQPFEIVFSKEAISDHGRFFKDYDIHKKLEENGFKRVNGEWFECTLNDIEHFYLELKTEQKLSQTIKDNFPLRPEQKQAVDTTKKYFTEFAIKYPNQSCHFLWNAKMRFGKTFTTYHLAKAMNWKAVLILTYKPSVEDAWKSDLENHIDFEGWHFRSRKSTESSPLFSDDNVLIRFASFQDILKKNTDGGIKETSQYLYSTKWDCIVIDEYHYGAWRETAKDFYDNKETEKEAELDIEQFDIDTFPIVSKHYLYLSGTPFRAVATGEFMEDQIYNWTYTDEQRAKRNWTGESLNPYLELPQIVLMTYKLPSAVSNIAKDGEYNEFDLNEFFKANSKNEKQAVFEHEDDVQKWLHLIRGSKELIGLEYTKDNTLYPFSNIQLLQNNQHTLWFLPSVDSCRAMKSLLEQPQNIFYHDYKCIVAAGKEAGIGLDAVKYVKKEMGNTQKTKSITLTCGKLITGTSIPAWGSVFFLRNITSPEAYFQTAFRAQTPYTLPNLLDPNSKCILKKRCYIFDFAPNRALSLLQTYSSRLDINQDNLVKRVEEILNYLPVLSFDGGTMQSLNAEDILNITLSGVASSMLAKRWQDSNAIDISIQMLEKILADTELLNSLMQIEAFRNLNTHISKMIANTKEIKDIKKNQNLGKDEKSKELKDKEKQTTDLRKELRDKLLKFITRIPVFMYLTDAREETLQHIIKNIEPQLFTTVTGLKISDFDKMCTLGIFKQEYLNENIATFKRIEDYSFSYLANS